MTKENRLPMTVSRESSVISLTFANSQANQLNSSNDNLVGADLHNVDLSGANLSGADLRNANLRGADLRGANLSGADLRGSALTNANLRGANLNRTMLSGATLSCADLRGTDLSNSILSGANLWDANLSGATLDRANLWDANLSGANLSGANLKGAILSSADLRSADLSRSSLWGANLSGANCSRAKLANVDFSNADLSTANFWNVDLTSADLSSALVQDTRFGQNQGLTQTTQFDLTQRGAIFVNSLADRKSYGSSQFESKNAISQEQSPNVLEAIASHISSPNLLPTPTATIASVSSSTSISSFSPTPNFPKSNLSPSSKHTPQIGYSDNPQSQYLEDVPTQSTADDSKSWDESVPTVGPIWIPEYDSSESDDSTEIYLEPIPTEVPTEVSTPDRYLSPAARTAIEIRNRRARAQTKQGREPQKTDESLKKFSYRFS